MDEKRPEIDDPFRRYRRLPDKPKRAGDSTARPAAQWKGPVPPPRATGSYPAQSNPSEELTDSPARDNDLPLSGHPEENDTPSGEFRTARPALLADIAAAYERSQSGEVPVARPEATRDSPVRNSNPSGELLAASSRPSGESQAASADFLPPWKPSGEVAEPTSKDSGTFSVHQKPRTSGQVITPSRLGTGDPLAAKRNSGEFRTASTRSSGGQRAAGSRPSGEVPVAPSRTSRDFTTVPRRFSGEIELSPEVPSKEDSPARSPAVPSFGQTNRDEKPHRRRSTDPKTSDTWKSSVLLAAFAIALVGYAFNIGAIQTAVGSALNGLNSSGQASGIVTTLLRITPWLLLIPVVALFYAILYTLAGLIGLRKRGQNRRSRREKQTSALDQFKKIAYAQGVQSRVAYQGFSLLQQFLPEGHTLSPEDTLEGDLAMAPAQVRSLRLSLLAKIDRESDPGARLPKADTVLAVLLSAQQAPRRATAPLTPVQMPGDPGRRRQ